MSLASRLPPQPTPRPGPARPAPRPKAPDAGPPRGTRERRRRPRGRLSRMLTGPAPAWLEAALRSMSGPARRVVVWGGAALAVAALAWVAGSLWWRGPALAPRHRAEALCF